MAGPGTQPRSASLSTVGLPFRPRSLAWGTTRTPGMSAAARYSAALTAGGAIVSDSSSPIVPNACWSGLCP
jgi:hypothetical protein